eukprot:gene4438-6875_t
MRAGLRVEVKGLRLEQFAKLNGQKGDVVGKDDQHAGRWLVALEEGIVPLLDSNISVLAVQPCRNGHQQMKYVTNTEGECANCERPVSYGCWHCRGCDNLECTKCTPAPLGQLVVEDMQPLSPTGDLDALLAEVMDGTAGTRNEPFGSPAEDDLKDQNVMLVRVLSKTKEKLEVLHNENLHLKAEARLLQKEHDAALKKAARAPSVTPPRNTHAAANGGSTSISGLTVKSPRALSENMATPSSKLGVVDYHMRYIQLLEEHREQQETLRQAKLDSEKYKRDCDVARRQALGKEEDLVRLNELYSATQKIIAGWKSEDKGKLESVKEELSALKDHTLRWKENAKLREQIAHMDAMLATQEQELVAKSRKLANFTSEATLPRHSPVNGHHVRSHAKGASPVSPIPMSTADLPSSDSATVTASALRGMKTAMTHITSTVNELCSDPTLQDLMRKDAASQINSRIFGSKLDMLKSRVKALSAELDGITIERSGRKASRIDRSPAAYGMRSPSANGGIRGSTPPLRTGTHASPSAGHRTHSNQRSTSRVNTPVGTPRSRVSPQTSSSILRSRSIEDAPNKYQS